MIGGPGAGRAEGSARPRALPLMALLSALCAVPGHGQLSVGVAPHRVEKIVRAGTSVTDVITLHNDSALPVEVAVEVVDFDVTEEGQIVERAAGILPATIAPFLEIRPMTARIAPGQRSHFRYTVETPGDFSQLRGLILFASEPQVPPATGPRVLIAPTLGVPFYVENRSSEAGRLEVESVAWRRAATGGLLELELELANLGDRNARPSGFLEVRSPESAFFEVFPFNPGSEAVLPGHPRRWKMTFGPVPKEPLSLHLRFSTSLRRSHSSRHELAATGG